MDAVIVATAPKVERLSRHFRKWFDLPGLNSSDHHGPPERSGDSCPSELLLEWLSLYPLVW
jgi:hypothetical protein